MRKFSINESALSCYLREFAEGNNYEMPSEHQIAAVLRLLNYEPASPPPSAPTSTLTADVAQNTPDNAPASGVTGKEPSATNREVAALGKQPSAVRAEQRRLEPVIRQILSLRRELTSWLEGMGIDVAPPSARPAERDEARLRSALEEISRLAHEAYDHPELANTHFMAIAVFADSQQPLKEAEIRRAKELAAAPKSSSLGEEKMNFEDCGEQSAPASRSQIKRQAVMQGKSMTEACKLAAAPDAGQPEVFCGYCGALNWTIARWGRIAHKHSCPQNPVPHDYCQSDCRKQAPAPSAPASAAREWVKANAAKYVVAGEIGIASGRMTPYWGIETAERMLDAYAAEQTRQLREENATFKAKVKELGIHSDVTGVVDGKMQVDWYNVWKREFNMYRNAWLRELHHKLIPKSHEIDALVLTTRQLWERAQAAEAERDKAKYELSEIRRKLNTVVGDVKQGISPMAQFAALATLIKAIAMEPTQK